MTCAEVSDRIVDHLYGELRDEQKRGFDEHLATCESCRREVATLQRTLGDARAALQGPLAEEPPVRVREAVLAAAAAAGGRRAVAAGTAGEWGASFWAWLRKPWFLPAFGAASLMVLYLLVRPVVSDAEREVRQVSPGVASAPAGPESNQAKLEPTPAPDDERAAPVAAARPAPAPAPPAVASEAAPARKGGHGRGAAGEMEAAKEEVLAPEKEARANRYQPEKKLEAKQDAPAMRRPAAPSKPRAALAMEDEATRGAGADRRWASPPPPARMAPAAKPVVRAPRELDAEGLGGVSVGASAGRPVSTGDGLVQAEDKRKRESGLAGGAASRSGSKVVVEKTARAPEPAPAQAARGPSPAPAQTAPTPAAPPPAPTRAEAPPPPPAGRFDQQRRPPSYAPPPSGARESAPPAAEAPAPPADRGQRDDEDTSAQSARRGREGAGVDELARRADRLFTDGRWNEAVTAYRELLRLYPAHKNVAQWKQRLEAADRAAGLEKR